MNIPAFVLENKDRFDQRLSEILTTAETPYQIVSEAMHYSVTLGGKRIRPCLVLESCRACGGKDDGAIVLGCALEMVHTYSLIHDDLPCMDDDDLRRGQPSCHKKYGYANALLAGDALLTKAFETIAEADTLSADAKVNAVSVLSSCAGIDGMVGGQVLDLAYEGKPIDFDTLALLNRLKTGRLLVAAVKLGAVAGGADDSVTEALTAYAENLGAAFQIRDDILDIISDTATLGKPVGSDAENQKNTYATMVGVEAAEREVERLTAAACDALFPLGDSAENLKKLAHYLCDREN